MLRIDARRPQAAQLRQAAAVLARGGLVVFPTACIYGLGADASNPAALRRVFAVKGRPAKNPLLVLIPDRDAVSDLVLDVPPAAERLMARFWPGRITLVMKAAAGVAPELTGGTGKIGVRLPGHPAAAALVRNFGRPITGTSANPSGRTGCRRIKDLSVSFLQSVDLVLDAGALAGGVGSTIVDVTVTPPAVLREGRVPAGQVQAALEA
jgi:L-threonylcarbamoyladenylate synthase